MNAFRTSFAARMEFLDRLMCDHDLGDRALRVAFRLMNHMNDDTGECFPSHETMAAHLRVSKKTVQRAVEDLVKRGWFRTQERGRGGTQYYANWSFQVEEGGQPLSTLTQHERWTGPDRKVDTNTEKGGLLVSTEPNNHKPLDATLETGASLPVGSAGDFQPPGATPAGPKPHAANAVWKANDKAVFDAFMFSVFEKVIEPLTVLSDTGDVLTLGALHNNHLDQLELAKGLNGRPAKAVLQEILDRRIEVRVWHERSPEQRQEAARQRRGKRLAKRTSAQAARR